MVITEGAYGLPDKTKVKIEKPESAGEEGDSDKVGKDSGGKGNAKPDAAKKDKGNKD